MRAYQPHNVWSAEQAQMLHTEFRDGNVPAGHEQLRVLKEALESLPAGVERVFIVLSETVSEPAPAAAWWQIMVLAMNLNTLFKREALGDGWVNRRLKALRYALIGIPGKVVSRARGLIVRVSPRHPAWEILLRARGRILALPLPAG